jgi:membrane-associated phospholipid phosphatase
MKKLANILSILLHPLLMPTLTYTIVAFIAPVLLQINPEYRFNLIWTIFTFTFLLPLALIFFLYFVGVMGRQKADETSSSEESISVKPKVKESVFIQSMTLEDRKERFFPFLLTTFLYTSLSYMLFTRHIFHLLAVVFAGVAFCMAVVTFISRYWKISAHSTGIAGTVGFLLGVYLKFGETELFYPILIAIFLTGLLMSARLYLNQHTLLQVFAGGILGFSVCLGVVMVWA